MVKMFRYVDIELVYFELFNNDHIYNIRVMYILNPKKQAGGLLEIKP